MVAPQSNLENDMAKKKAPAGRTISPHRDTVVAALERAVEKAGGTQLALATALGCTRQNIHHMFRYGRVDVERAKQIESLFGVSRRKLIPEAFN